MSSAPLPTSEFARRLESLQQRLEGLRRGWARHRETGTAFDALAALEMSLEELAATGAELRQQNNELAERRDALEGQWRRYLEMFELAPEAYVVVDERRLIREVNRAGGALLGVRPDRLIGKPLRVFLGPFERQAFDSRFRSLRSQSRGGASEWETEVVPRGRAPVPVAVTMTVVLDPIGKVSGARLLLRDIRERRRAQARLEAAAERLKGLSQRLADAEEAERRKLAQALRERVCDPLATVVKDLTALRDALPEVALGRIGPLLEGSLTELGTVTEAVGEVMSELRPAVLDQRGLEAALRWHAERTGRRSGLTVEVHAARNGHRLPERVETALFRIAQEALTNVACHARARRAVVTLRHGDGVVLAIADDGRGFDPTALAGRCPRGGWGLDAMRERAESVGGALAVDSGPGRGTVITVSVPG